ncbi:MAG: SDR family NAD(P)-dependent oxidoreductase, partial [Ilumatobacteraceae bacterium]
HPVLSGSIGDTLSESTGEASDGVPLLSATMRRGKPERLSLLHTLADLHCHGVDVDWAAVFPGRRRQHVLPTYPWQRQCHWMDVPERSAVRRTGPSSNAGPAARRVRSAAIHGALFEFSVSTATTPYLDEHRIGEIAVVPMATLLDLAMSAVAEVTATNSLVIEDVELLAALTLGGDGSAATVHVHVEPSGADMLFNVSSVRSDDVVMHATGRARALPAGRDDERADSRAAVLDDRRAVQVRCSDRRSSTDVYAGQAARGVRLGGSFRALVEAGVGHREAIARLVAPPETVVGAGVLHPALVDASMHALALLLPDDGDTYLPISLGSMRLHRGSELPPPTDAEPWWSHVRLEPSPQAGLTVTASIRVHTDDGRPVAELDGLRLVRTSPAAIAAIAGHAADVAAELFEVAWQPLDIGDPAAIDGALIVADTGGVATALGAMLKAQGSAVVAISADQPLTPAAVAAALDATPAGNVVFLRGVDMPAVESADAARRFERQRPALDGALAVLKAAIGAEQGKSTVWLVTCGAEGVGGPPRSPQQAMITGLASALRHEHPGVRCVCIDLDPGADEMTNASALRGAIAGAPRDERLAIRDGVLLAARLVPVGTAGDESPTMLVSDDRGVLDSLHLEPAQRRAPGRGEIEVRVHVTGLNFRDVLIAVDLYPEHSATFGDECCGEVLRVGAGVQHVRPGDRVVAMGSGAFATHLTTNADLVVRVPDGIPDEQAATIPIAFLTAQYSLVELGRLVAGERVLVHAAAGGVGMAAVQLAQRLGAEVYATVGSAEKRAALTSLGVRHVFDSRSLSFADDVLAATGGRGVDVVLNSLSGDFIARSLDVLAVGGRFLEIGRRDVWSPERVAAARPDAEYHIVFLGDLTVGDPAAIRRMLDTLMPRFASGELRPLPVTEYDSDHVVDAFRLMAQARHIGKIVVRQRRVGVVPINTHGTYLVTGGLGGIGLALAGHLVDQGARHVALVGRSEAGDAAQKTINELRERGADVQVFRADISERDQVAATFASIGESMPQLSGVIHAAGVNDDALLHDQTWERIAAVLGPKVGGAVHIDELSAGIELDMYVLVSSAASVVGGPAQANYAAANAFLDAFAAQRRAGRGTGLSIGWGPWNGVGMTAQLGRRDLDRMRGRGFVPLDVPAALAGFDATRIAGAAGSAHVVCALLNRQLLGTSPLFESLRPVAPAPEVDLLRTWADTVPAMRRSVVTAFVSAQARKVLGLAAHVAIATRQPFQELGLDSLMAVELRNAVGRAVGRPQPATLLFDH